MKRKEMPAPVNPHVHDVLGTSVGVLGHGTMVSIEGLKGRFKFMYGWNDSAGTFWGPVNSKSAKMRTFTTERVTKIHKEKVPKE